MKGLGETSPFHRFTNPRRDKSGYFWSCGTYLLFKRHCVQMNYPLARERGSIIDMKHNPLSLKGKNKLVHILKKKENHFQNKCTVALFRYIRDDNHFLFLSPGDDRRR